MRVACFVNNWLGWKCVEALRVGGDEIVGLVIHPEARRKFGNDILEAADIPVDRVFMADRLRDEETLRSLGDLGAEMGVSILFGYLLKPECLELFPRGVINLHPSYLPYNRGSYPNVWSIVEGTPTGVTLHMVDEGIDSGAILAQRRVPVLPTDTGETLYRRLEQHGLELFWDEWPRIAAGELEPRPQEGEGTTHKIKDVDQVDCIDLEKSYPARYLIDLLRARTFSSYPGAYFEENGRRVYLRLELSETREAEQAKWRKAS